MIGPGISRALIEQHDAELARRAKRPRTPEPGLAADIPPAASVVAGILIAAAIGLPLFA
jgi:hypothetical protein